MMIEEESDMTEQILNLTLEIMYLLTGEDYIVVKTSGDRVTNESPHHVSEGLNGSKSPNMESLPLSLIRDKNDKKILEVTQKIIELLAGEVSGAGNSGTLSSNRQGVCLDGDIWRTFLALTLERMLRVVRSALERMLRVVRLVLQRMRLVLQRMLRVVRSALGRMLRVVRSGLERMLRVVRSGLERMLRVVRSALERMLRVPGYNNMAASLYRRHFWMLRLCSFFQSALGGEGISGGSVQVLIRCQEVTAYFSLGEWKDLEGHKDLYKDSKMENQLGGSIDRNPPERSPSPDSYNAAVDFHELNIIVKEEEIAIPVTVKEEVAPVDIGIDAPKNEDILEVCLAPSPGDCKTEHNDIALVPPEENSVAQNIQIVLCSASILPNPTNSIKLPSPIAPPTNCRRKKVFPCPDCGKNLSHKANLIAHRRIHTGEKPFCCPDCGRAFTQKSDLARHQRIHTGEKPFACPHCDRCFTQKSDLALHKNVHAGEKPFPCSDCGKKFTRKSVLIRHRRIHTDENPFPCPECGKCFVQRSDLVYHLRIHVGDKPFSCDECGKSFIGKSDLVTHQRIHTGEKPFACTDCSKRFAHRTMLINHQRVHTGERPFFCMECGKSFMQKASLIYHQRLHRGEKPFPCLDCSRSFTQKSDLVRHQRTHKQ
ncbi:zinc finger protein 3-like [Rana temporaria]|uniref:zinc finger protein 3-like n=1 Tax=Rana temporaria TaxID=8407 RepID=UPI001AACE092|nr:zinc finger protein 3-like [Rana temporaria]